MRYWTHKVSMYSELIGTGHLNNVPGIKIWISGIWIPNKCIISVAKYLNIIFLFSDVFLGWDSPGFIIKIYFFSWVYHWKKAEICNSIVLTKVNLTLAYQTKLANCKSTCYVQMMKLTYSFFSSGKKKKFDLDNKLSYLLISKSMTIQ